MKLIFIAILVCCVHAEYQAIDPFLTGGAAALAAEFPSAVFIQAPGTPNQPLCGGTIIDSQHILTSAQCVLNTQNQLINPFWYRVTAGDLNIVTPTSRRITRTVSRIYVHPNYSSATRNK